jgi:Domain of unknown function (DUF3332).
MKKLRVLALVLGVSILSSSCYGPFRLTTKLHTWNGQIGDKFINALVFFAFVVIPVYGVTTFVDALVFNTIEFWGGNNPISMKEGEVREQLVEKNGQSMKLTASRNKCEIEVLSGENKGQKTTMIYDEKESAWMLQTAEGNQKLVQMVEDADGNAMTRIFMPDGTSFDVDPAHTTAAQLQQMMDTQQLLASK